MEAAAKFNTLLFDEETNLLTAICAKLVFSCNDAQSVETADALLDYFTAFDRLPELMLWAFKKDFHLRGLFARPDRQTSPRTSATRPGSSASST